ncbi:hypothetical protein QQ045_007161 [Rhodiola kirilowii]
MALCKLFDERPVWPKLSVAERLGSGFVEDMILGKILYCDANADIKYEQKWADLCAFKCFPYGCQISLQLCELDDDYIQQEIRKPVKESTCSRAARWFSVPVIDNLRRKIKVHKEIMVDEEIEDNQQATQEVLPVEEADDDELDDDEDDEEYGEAIGISGEDDDEELEQKTRDRIRNFARQEIGIGTRRLCFVKLELGLRRCVCVSSVMFVFFIFLIQVFFKHQNAVFRAININPVDPAGSRFNRKPAVQPVIGRVNDISDPI